MNYKAIIFLFFLILTITTNTSFSEVHGTEDWVARYLSPCPKTPNNRVCFDKTRRNFKRMLKYKDMMFKYLEEYNLDKWLATIPFIESEYTEKARSKRYSKRLKRDLTLAVGLWQVSPGNLQSYLTTFWNGINYKYRRSPKLSHAIKLGYKPKISTEVACKLLVDLYANYRRSKYKVYIKNPDDIDRFVVMAYNAGQTRIDNALKGIGKPLKPETLNYYFQLTALQVMLDDITNKNIYELR